MVMVGAAVKDSRPCDPACLLFVVYGREVTRIDGNHEWLTSNVIRSWTNKYGIYWLATTANGGALIRWSRVRVPPAPLQNAWSGLVTSWSASFSVRARRGVDAARGGLSAARWGCELTRPKGAGRFDAPVVLDSFDVLAARF
jgi:hypothetical protein